MILKLVLHIVHVVQVKFLHFTTNRYQSYNALLIVKVQLNDVHKNVSKFLKNIKKK